MADRSKDPERGYGFLAGGGDEIFRYPDIRDELGRSLPQIAERWNSREGQWEPVIGSLAEVLDAGYEGCDTFADARDGRNRLTD